MAAKRPDPAVVALLQDLLQMAKDGEIDRVFAVYGDSFECFNHDYAAVDGGDLILQVRTEIIRAQSDLDRSITQH